MAAVVVEIVDGVVAHQVAIVEEQTIETHTISEFQLVVYLPFVLSIDAQGVELHARGGILFTVVTIGEADDFGCGTREEVVDAGITIIARSVAHIGVVGHLMFELHAGCDFVVAGEIGHIVLDVPNLVVHRIVVGKEFFAERHVVAGGARSV